MATAAIESRPFSPKSAGPQQAAELDPAKQSSSFPTTQDRLRLTHALNNPVVDPPSAIPAHHIVSSPYTAPQHLLDLRRRPTTAKLFARALQSLSPLSESYATDAYESGFNWDALFARLRELADEEEGFEWPRTAFYVVTFKSVLRADADRERLGLLDAKSHEEAVESGGLLKYWFGVPDGERRNLATCFWHSREDARDGGKGPWHKQARLAAPVMYETIRFETRRLTVEDGVSGWKWETWEDQ